MSKPNPKIILFKSMPDYSDNSRALSDYLIEHGYQEKYDIYWEVDNPAKYKRTFAQNKIRFICNRGMGRFNEMKIGVQAAWSF